MDTISRATMASSAASNWEPSQMKVKEKIHPQMTQITQMKEKGLCLFICAICAICG